MTQMNASTDTMSTDEFTQNLIVEAEEWGPGITHEQIGQIEEIFSGEALGITRRLSLAILSMPFPELREKVVSNDNFAVAVADAFECLDTKYYTEMANLLQAAQVRMMVAISHRPDMDEILEKVKHD